MDRLRIDNYAVKIKNNRLDFHTARENNHCRTAPVPDIVFSSDGGENSILDRGKTMNKSVSDWV
jgi:hypothetical protein